MRKMRNVLAIVLAGVMLFALSACGTGNTGGTAAPAGSSNESEGGAGAVAGSAADAEYTLIFSTNDPASSIHGQLWQSWADKINEATEGRVFVETHFNGELVDGVSAMPSLQQGTIDVAFCPVTTDANFKLDLIKMLVSASDTCQRPSKVYNELLQNEDFAEPYKDYHVVALFSMYDNIIATKDSPIKAPEDFKGRNLAVTSSIEADWLAKLGANGVFVEPGGEYTNLEKGVIDGGAAMPFDNFISASWGEQVDYLTMMPQITSGTAILMSNAAWDSLPADIQEQIDGTTDWFIDHIDETYFNRAMEVLPKLEEEYGVEYVWLTDEEKAAIQESRDETIQDYIDKYEKEGIDASGFYDLYKKTVEKYSTEEYMFNPDWDWSGPVW